MSSLTPSEISTLARVVALGLVAYVVTVILTLRRKP